MTELDVTVRHSSGATEPLTLMVSRMVNCGRAWRDPPDESRQEAWTEQLNESGLSRQESEPFVFPKPPNLITTDDEIWVNSRRTYGEAEFVMFPTSDAVYVAVGVDNEESTRIRRSGRVSSMPHNYTIPLRIVAWSRSSTSAETTGLPASICEISRSRPSHVGRRSSSGPSRAVRRVSRLCVRRAAADRTARPSASRRSATGSRPA